VTETGSATTNSIASMNMNSSADLIRKQSISQDAPTNIGIQVLKQNQEKKKKDETPYKFAEQSDLHQEHESGNDSSSSATETDSD